MSVPGMGHETVDLAADDTSSSDEASENDSEPLMEQIPNDDEAVPMDESGPITEFSNAKPRNSAHFVSGGLEWTVLNYSRLSEKEYSEKFEVCGSTWRILLFPRGNNKTAGRSMAVYVDCPDLDQQEPGWTLHADFVITLVHQDDESKSIRKAGSHPFNRSEADWGFSDLLSLGELQQPGAGWLRDDKLRLRVEVCVNTLDSSCYDSKKETGYVGLRNQGATCYLNSWLQTLFNINCFRQAVFHIPTTEEDEPHKSIPLALQTLFYKLQFGNRAVSTQDLTKSFGWDSTGAFMQEDVHEFNKILMEALETKMKGTKVEGVINKLFEGQILKFIECLNVDYKSTKKDEYMDIFLDVKGCKNVYESFDRLTAEERLEGDNQYNAEGHGMQDAKIGDLFDNFPPVLQLHLKRFEYDFERDVRVKINDRYEFEETLDLDVGDRKYLSKDADASKRNKYKLHSVLVHSGGTHGGHYYAFSRPDGATWLRFEDEKVTQEDAQTAIEEQYGGDGSLPPAPGFRNVLGPCLARFSSAYMLLYIREEEWDAVMCDVPETAVALHLRERLKAEEAERLRLKRERDEAHRFTVIRVATSADMQEQIGRDTFFDLVDFSKVKSFRVQKQTLFGEFRGQLETEFGVPRARQRLWFWEQRPNFTLRPWQPVPPDADEQQVQTVRTPRNVKNPHQQGANELFLWLEDVTSGRTALSPSEQILFFLKHYDPRAGTLKLVIHTLLHPGMRLSLLADKLAAKLSLPRDRLKFMEEVKYDPYLMLEPLPEAKTIKQLQPEGTIQGDIIICQEALPKAEVESVRHPTVEAFLMYIQLRRVITFKRLAEPKEEGVKVELLGSAGYEGIVTAAAAALGVANPQLLRLTQHYMWTGGPLRRSVKWTDPDLTLDKLLPSPDAHFLYYEVLEMPLAQLEQMREFEVVLHNAKTEEVGRFRLCLHRDMVVGDVLRLLRERAGAAWASKPLRLLQVRDSELFKVYEDSDSIADFNDYWQLAAHEVPGDEADAAAAAAPQQPSQPQPVAEQQHLVRMRHLPPPSDSSEKPGLLPRAPSAFGVPFVMAVSPTEMMAAVRARVQARLGVPDMQFADWRFRFVPDMSSRTEYLEDSDLLAAKFVRRSGDAGSRTSDGDYLALEHPDTGPKRQKRVVRDSLLAERPMRIG